ncbi:MAG: FAD-dependent oxidoreductase [Clostridia bacterium]|nr:FAD-dependent oxidoreductase [Clostridia bacterium]
MKQSIWQKDVVLPQFKSIQEDKKTDVLIIGGGLCGLLCAYYLEQAGVPYILLEGSRIAAGTTGYTTAKITSQHGLIYAKTLQAYGTEKAQMYLKSNELALSEYEKLCSNADCDFEKKNAYTYSVDDRRKIEEEVRAVNRLGFGATFEETYELPFRTAGAVCFRNQAQFHPLKFITMLAKNLNIFEESFVDEIAPHGVWVNGHRVQAEKIIVTTHFPFINKHGSYFLKLYQHRSYVSAFDNVPTFSGMYVDENKKGLSFRTYKNLLLLGGSGHRTGKQSGAWGALSNQMRAFYPEAVLRGEWAAQDCMSLDGIPYIGQYAKNTPDLYVASGFNKWGMTSSMVAAMILSDMVQGKKNEFAEVYSPQISILKPQLVINGLESTVNLLTPTKKRCPHLGCALKWNRAEHSWDCPCHGSRFDEDGSLLNNPATGDLDSKKP